MEVHGAVLQLVYAFFQTRSKIKSTLVGGPTASKSSKAVDRPNGLILLQPLDGPHLWKLGFFKTLELVGVGGLVEPLLPSNLRSFGVGLVSIWIDLVVFGRNWGLNLVRLCCFSMWRRGEMAVPLLSKKVVKKRVKKFKRPQSDRKISVKVVSVSSLGW